MAKRGSEDLKQLSNLQSKLVCFKKTAVNLTLILISAESKDSPPKNFTRFPNFPRSFPTCTASKRRKAEDGCARGEVGGRG